MYVPYGIDFKTMNAIQKKRQRRTKRIFLKIRRIFKRKTSKQ